tara:strand:+ start:4157 stop:5995 length:1839 start_codon:yes stop_codon:yes gene_type:complete
MPRTNDYLDKLNTLYNNDSSITFIVTFVILFTFFVFILLVYYFLSKSNTNCNNINKNYKNIFTIDKTNNITDDDKILNKSQEKRIIDISFSCTFDVKNNLQFVDSISDDLTKEFETNDILPINAVTSNSKIQFKLKDLSMSFVDEVLIGNKNVKTINNENVIKFFSNNNSLVIKIDDTYYYKFDCKNTVLNQSNDNRTAPTGSDTAIAQIPTDDRNLNIIKAKIGENYTYNYIYNSHIYDKATSNKQIIAIKSDHIYIPADYVKIKQDSLKYTYTIKPDNINNVIVSRDITLLNNNSNIEKMLNKIQNNYILTAYNCCNSGEYQNNYVDTCILNKCLYLGIRCLDFQIFNYNNKPIIASSTMNSLYIKETFNYLELEPVLDIIKTYLKTSSELNSPLFLHFRVMSLSEKIYKQLIKSILNKFTNNTNNGVMDFELVIDNSNKRIENMSLCELNKKIVIFIHPYNTTNNYIIQQLDNYITAVKEELSIKTDYKIYKSGNITNIEYDMIVYKKDNYDIYRDSHNKSKLTLVLPQSDNKNNDESFVKYMQNNITFIPMKFQELDNYLQVAVHIFTKYQNNSGFMLKNTIDSNTFEVKLEQDGTRIFNNNIDVSDF